MLHSGFLRACLCSIRWTEQERFPMVWILLLNWHQKGFFAVPQPSETVDAVKWETLPQGLPCRRIAKARGFWEEHSSFPQGDLHPAHPGPGCPTGWAVPAYVRMDALLLGHSGSANSLIPTALTPSAFPGLCRVEQLMPFSGFSSRVLCPALTAMACQRAPTLALLWCRPCNNSWLHAENSVQILKPHQIVNDWLFQHSSSCKTWERRERGSWKSYSCPICLEFLSPPSHPLSHFLPLYIT